MQPSFDLARVTSDALQDDFRAFIRAAGFPCVGAKSALASGAISLMTGRDIRSGWDDLSIHRQLCAFGASLSEPSKNLRSFAVLYQAPDGMSEVAFEQALWARLQSLRDKDKWLSYRHDARVAADPGSPEFAFSIGGEAYFVVGLHPGASRRSRRAPMPAIVFNPFAQFEQLRAEGRYRRMSDVVQTRDETLCGSPNPMLADHGSGSAARQFSGRIVSDDWVCPFKA